METKEYISAFKFNIVFMTHCDMNYFAFQLTSIWFQEHGANFCLNYLDPIHQANSSLSEMNQ